LAERAPEKQFYACDSFQGFPEEQVGRVDVGFLRRLGNLRKKFKLAGDTPHRLRNIFAAFGVKGEPVIGYFSDTLPLLEHRPLCFIHLDCDIYSSYKECLDRLYKSLVPGGIVAFDEYRSRKWPGAERAVDEFFDARPEKPEACGKIWYVRKPLEVPGRLAHVA
jgi:hypothetical protein